MENRYLSPDVRNRWTHGQNWVHCRKIISQTGAVHGGNGLPLFQYLSGMLKVGSVIGKNLGRYSPIILLILKF